MSALLLDAAATKPTRLEGAGRHRYRDEPGRVNPASWPATAASADQVLAMLGRPPFVGESASTRCDRRHGAQFVLAWLAAQPGESWQERWVASGADALGARGRWKRTASAWWQESDQAVALPRGHQLGSGVTVLICMDVIRPSLDWMCALPQCASWIAQTRDPDGFAALCARADARTGLSPQARANVLNRAGILIGAKGGTVRATTIGDCLELAESLRVRGRKPSHVDLHYQLLRELGAFPGDAPPLLREILAQGPPSIEAMVDRYQIECRPIRDLLVDYLRERRASMDHTSLGNLARFLAKLFWRDLELHHPGIDSLHLSPEVAAGWAARIRTRTLRRTGPQGQIVEHTGPRAHATNQLFAVRAFYLDLAQWALDDPSHWARWAVPCPIRIEASAWGKEKQHHKSRMDQRTRERLPALPALAAVLHRHRVAAAESLRAARQAEPGEAFTAHGRTLLRVAHRRSGACTVYATDPATGAKVNLVREERDAFWSWALVEVLRHTGIRIEELSELTHHAVVQYRLPGTGELVPLLQIVPSKTDTERLLLVGPQLADVLSAIITRVRTPDGSLPPVPFYDSYEHQWYPPAALLFQYWNGLEHRPLTPGMLRPILTRVIARLGFTGPSGGPLHFTPHDFRRMFVTDAILNGLPPHIAQILCGHKDINTTMGYKAAYPTEAITAHHAFLTRRRAARPAAEYRTPTEAEWQQFLGHFERRKVSLGTCARAYGSDCAHEHACIRCPILWPDPAARARLEEIRENLTARIAEAEREGWLGEAEGLRISLAGAQRKLAEMTQADARAQHPGPQIVAATITVLSTSTCPKIGLDLGGAD